MVPLIPGQGIVSSEEIMRLRIFIPYSLFPLPYFCTVRLLQRPVRIWVRA